MKTKLICLLFLLLICNANAGLFSRFQDPPVTLTLHWQVGPGIVTLDITNTSDDFIYAVTVTSVDGKTSFVVANSIEAHKTVTFKANSGEFAVLVREFKITCKDYGTKTVEEGLKPQP